MASRIIALISLAVVFGAAAFAQEPAEEGSFTITGVKVDGNKLFPDDQIRDFLRIEKGQKYDRYLFDYLLERGITSIKEAYAAEGYAEAGVRWTFRDVKTATRKLQVRVDEGPRALIAELVMEGVSPTYYMALRQDLGVEVGSPMSASALNAAARNITRFYADRGYVHAKAELSINRTNNTVAFKVQEGSVYYVGDIIVAGNERTRPRIITRELDYKLKPDRLCRASKIDESRGNIYRTGLYRDLKVETVDSPRAADKVDILVIVREDKFKWYKLEPGYASPDRAAMTVGWGHNNVFGNNQRLAAEVSEAYGFATRESSFKADITYTEPWLFGYRYKGVSTALYDREIYRHIRTWEVGLEPKVTREITEHFEVTGGLRFARANIEVAAAEKGPLVIMPFVGPRSLLALPGVTNIGSIVFSSALNTRDDVFNPLAGSYLYGSEETAGVVGGSDFWRVIGDGRRYNRVGPAACMAGHLRGGFIRTYAETREVPYTERFFSGGAFTVRGYGERLVGPTDVNGDPVGGNFFLLANAELRFQMPFLAGRRIPGIGLNLGNLWGGIFADGGNVWLNWNQAKKGELRYGAGLGLRYNTPVGPVRIDYGHPVITEGAAGRGRFYLAFGHIF